MKETESELKERCRLVREKYGIKHNPELDKIEIKPSAKTREAEEMIRRYGLPKAYYDSLDDDVNE